MSLHVRHLNSSRLSPQNFTAYTGRLGKGTVSVGGRVHSTFCWSLESLPMDCEEGGADVLGGCSRCSLCWSLETFPMVCDKGCEEMGADDWCSLLTLSAGLVENGVDTDKVSSSHLGDSSQHQCLSRIC